MSPGHHNVICLVAMRAIRLIIAHVLLAVHARVQNTRFDKCSEVSSPSCDGKGNILFEMATVSRVQCLAMCRMYVDCKGVSYNTTGHMCKGYSKHICLDQATQYYILRNGSSAASTYTYIGCFKDKGDDRAMGAYIQSQAMTNDVCYNTCRSDSLNNAYFGTQHGVACFCAPGVDATYDKHGGASESDCKETCLGNASQICGGGWRNSVFFMNKVC